MADKPNEKTEQPTEGKPEAKTGDIVPSQPKTGEVVTVKEHAMMTALSSIPKDSPFMPIASAVITGKTAEELPDDDPEIAWARIFAQIFSAQTPDEVLSDIEAVGLRTLLDRPLDILDVDFQQSSYEEGSPFFAVIKIRDHNSGDEVLATCGAKRIIGQLLALKMRGWFPQVVYVRQAERPTKAGFYPLRMVMA